MKKLAEIPCQLMERGLASSLKLNEQPYLILIPKPMIASQGITENIITFELVVNDGKLSLIGPTITKSPRVTQSTVEEIDT
jgi:hypothetical protein